MMKAMAAATKGGAAVPREEWVHLTGLVFLWGAAMLTLVTCWDYLRVGLKHMD